MSILLVPNDGEGANALILVAAERRVSTAVASPYLEDIIFGFVSLVWIVVVCWNVTEPSTLQN